MAFPAVATAGRPWARIMSCNPLEMPKDPDVPARLLRLPHGREAGRLARLSKPSADRTHRGRCGRGSTRSCWTRERRAWPDLGFMIESPSLNLSLTQADEDYVRAGATRRLRGTASIRASVRPTTRSNGRAGFRAGSDGEPARCLYLFARLARLGGRGS